MEKIILCIDMDAFFASVEQQVNPRLRGKPIAVIGSGARTVVTTRSYEARKYGVKTGMNIYEARQLCPHLILVVGDNEKYTHTCIELEKVYRRFTPDVEVYSIDEAFLDITTTHHLFGGPVAIGAEIKKCIREVFGISCTVGIAPTFLLAKLASDLSKPDGLRWIRAMDAPSVLEDIPVKELWGIGSRTAENLASLGIRTCGELGRAPVSLLRNRFGIIGETLKDMGRGLCNRSLVTREEDPKSIGHSITLPRDIMDRKEIESTLLKLCEMVGRRARKYGFMGRTVSLTLRYPDFETFTRQNTLSCPTNDTRSIYDRSLEILNGVRLRDSVRLLGVCLSHLVQDRDQMYLLADVEKQRSLLRAMDAINDKYGEFKIMHASYLKQAEPPGVISPAWRTSGVKNIKVK
ncbi:MAG: DNA polymerase IV [Alphaproteobacteria bacterium]|uniref:DNA polymerase IV n=1 Tax=Candidatus Nitrobium versatile TaxID=2884831 RepID=A0A953J9I4_9BACT|nr:DNA polymerase IV [Candidatus Nitrobium versatile]